MRSPLRRHDLPPITDGACAVVIARADKARELCENPVWITGFAHYSELHYPGMRDLTSSPSTTLAAKAAGLEEAPVEVAELQSRVHPRGAAARRGARPRRRRGGQPVGWAAGRQPDHGDRPRPHRRGRERRSATAASTARSRHSTSGPCLQQNLVCILEGEQVSHQPCAIVGIGQTQHKKARAGRVATAASPARPRSRALDDAHMTWSDIDAVVVGKAPDLFEGVMKPELYLTDALGATGKPMFRVHTAGSVGGTTGIVAVAPRRDRPPPAGARGRATRSSRRATRSSRSARARARRSAPAARSRRTCAATCTAPARPTTSGRWSR